jgi:pyridoxine 5-phosphate synthase
MTRLSVNVNKIATLRNSRGGNLPDLIQVAKDCEAFGAQGITVHPRPDERHIRYSDVPALKKIVTTEYNIEGFPSDRFLELVLANRPDQCTLVPDSPDVLTSDTGWDTIGQASFLKDVTQRLQEAGIRVSLFVDPIEKMVEGAKAAGADRIEFYTGDFAKQFPANPQAAVEPHVRAAKVANEVSIGINAGHDLNLDNLRFYKDHIENLLEVSIGHALICDALYYGLKNTIQLYLGRLA